MDWLHLSAPGPEFEATSPAHSAELRRRLDRSENIVVHCHGGLGRAGMIAVRLHAVSTPMRRSTGSAKRDPGAIETREELGPFPRYGSIQSRSGPNGKAAGRPKGGRIIIREKNREENIVTVCYQSTTVYDTVRQQCMIPSGNSSQALW